MNVLIIDDHGLVRTGLRAVLESSIGTYTIFEAGTCDSAIVMLSTMKFDVAFVDLYLGTSRTGIDVLRFIRSHDLTCRAIIISGDDNRDTVLECLAQGASGFIAKASGGVSTFEEALHSVIQGAIYLPDSVLSIISTDHPSHCNINSSLDPLRFTERQYEVLYYLCQGFSNKSIANLMGISEGTVRKSYVSDLLRIFHVSRRTELIIEVWRRRIYLKRPDRENPQDL